MTTPFLAHSANAIGHGHLLREHLSSGGRLAADFASRTSWGSEAKLAGLLHDLGKYGDLFQARLRGEESGLDHWSTGALVAALHFGSLAAALAIDGHHTGLQAAAKDEFGRKLHSLKANGQAPIARLRLSEANSHVLLDRARSDGVAFERPARNVIGVDGFGRAIAAMLDVRMLFSCLVDADFLDTEAHFNSTPLGKQPRAAGPMLDCDEALACLERFMSTSIRNKSAADMGVAEVRAAVWKEATQAADGPTGIFSLTAPTGSGKTLAMLQFALVHAKRNGLNRVILAVPFLSIIEQTARIYRSVFVGRDGHFVLEHHSLAGLGAEKAESDAEGTRTDDEQRQRRLLSENWDAPVVLTTNVQLLESLFSNRPSACRKLHNLQDAVVMFDEAQSLPQHLAVPTLAALSHLSAQYRASVVFATATQPAFDALHDAVRKHAISGWTPKEIVASHVSMFDRLRRVDVHWPKPNETLSWPALAAQLTDPAMRQSMCVVNLKRHAHALLHEMAGAEGLCHLSTNLCSAHRRQVLDEVRKRLDPGNAQPCRLISPQCVEAGVDLDFPVVYRAMAPLEAIAQAAGRCNREGRLNPRGRLGQVHVFEPAIDASSKRGLFPTFAYFQATEATASLLRAVDSQLDINDPSIFRRYYRALYDLNDPASQNKDLEQAIKALHFPEIARLYRLIEQDAIQIVVPWSQHLDEYERLRNRAAHGINARWIAEAQALSVSIYRPQRDHPAWGSLVPVSLRRGGSSDEWFVLEDPNRHDPERRLYDDTMGLRLPNAQQIMIA